MNRAKADGYNGIVFSNIWSTNSIENLADASSDYITRLTTIKNYASSLGLEFYPMIQTIMPGQQLLKDNPNMAEVFPVNNALYQVNNGQASLVADPAVSLPGGAFEHATNNVFSGWDKQDGAGITSFADTGVKHSGTQSLRIHTTGDSRISKTITVSPFRQYHVSVWMKTQGVTNLDGLIPNVLGVPSGRRLFFAGPSVSGTQDWTKYDFTFDSLDNSQVTISFGSYAAGGTIWIDDASIEELGMTNIVRRSDTPQVVESLNGTVYTEGVDYKAVTDPLLSSFQLYHASPNIILMNNSSIRNGQQLRVSFYYAALMPATLTNGFAAVSLADPDATSFMDDEMNRTNALLDPQGVFLNYDEVRVGNWENSTAPMTEGQLLASSIQRARQTYRSINSSGSFFVWDDMFDPYQNAIDDYYLTNGTVNGSWDGLSSDITVVNWNYPNRTDAFQFFTDHGNPQIIVGYYDNMVDVPPISRWLSDTRSINASVVGVMYTTWMNDYSGLESFAHDAWGGEPTITPTPTPSATPTPTPTPPTGLPVASFSISPQSGQPPLTVTVTDNSTGATWWQYNFGDNTPNATTKNPAHTYTSSKVYTVVETVGNIYGTSSTTKQVTVGITPTPTPTPSPGLSLPTAGFSITPQSGHSPLDIFITDTSAGATSWQYNFGDNTPNATTKNPTHTYITSRTYTVTQTVSNASGSATTTKQVVVS